MDAFNFKDKTEFRDTDVKTNTILRPLRPLQVLSQHFVCSKAWHFPQRLHKVIRFLRLELLQSACFSDKSTMISILSEQRRVSSVCIDSGSLISN